MGGNCSTHTNVMRCNIRLEYYRYIILCVYTHHILHAYICVYYTERVRGSLGEEKKKKKRGLKEIKTNRLMTVSVLLPNDFLPPSPATDSEPYIIIHGISTGVYITRLKRWYARAARYHIILYLCCCCCAECGWLMYTISREWRVLSV